MLLTRKFTRLLTTVLSIALAASLFVLPASAKSKKGKSARSKASASKQARSGKSSRRQSARRGKRGRSRNVQSRNVQNNVGGNEFAGNHPIVPDNVEVIEQGSANPTELSRWLNPPAPSSQTNAAFDAAATNTAVRSRKVNIDSERVIQIQQALAKRGLYAGETTGVYDEATIDAMRRFQISNKIAVTGYPTAHSLKRLGLGSW